MFKDLFHFSIFHSKCFFSLALQQAYLLRSLVFEIDRIVALLLDVQNRIHHVAHHLVTFAQAWRLVTLSPF
jgi:hypothetical protein